MAKKRKKGKSRKAQPEASRSYEAAMSTPSRRRVVGANGSQDSQAEPALETIRHWGRYLDENHDLASGILDESIQNIVGSGIVTIPKPLRPDDSIDEPLGVFLMDRFKRWARRCDVTGELSWHDGQRLICRAWLRDGEEFIQHVSGRTRGYPFAADEVPYRIELLESEFCPQELTNDQGWRQGVRRDAWKRPTAYGIYKQHPGDNFIPFGSMGVVTLDDVKVIPAEVMTHIKMVKRWTATRGVSIFSTVISRLYDLKDLEESERIKNRVLASWCAAVMKAPDVPGLEPERAPGSSQYEGIDNRYLSMAGGTVIDSLAPGESIVGVGPDYPVSGMADHINDQIRRIAAGTTTRQSSISKRYDGNYAAQRQELVESEHAYKIREDTFVSKVVRTVYEWWVQTALLDGQFALGPGQTLAMAQNAEFRGPITPWIDPLKEVQADALAVEAGFTSLDAIRIKRGAPAEMIGQPAPRPAQPAQLSLLSNDAQDDESDEEAA